jgi:proline dehydrogenase
VVELAEDQYERMNESIMTIAEALKEGNSVSKELHQVAERQVEVAERQVAVIEKQVEIAEKQLTIMQQTRPRHYSESDVWDLLEELRVTDPFRMQVYDHLCDNEHKKRKLFGVPPHMRGEALIRMMTDAGILR